MMLNLRPDVNSTVNASKPVARFGKVCLFSKSVKMIYY